ncbi:MAG: hypothetical protein ACOYYI_05720 [Chloroflexota bacterium]
MFQKKLRFAMFLTVGAVIVLSAALFTSVAAHADEPGPAAAGVQCIACHEDLYFLHDTGNWFCLRESPMTCVDCHGGNPNTLDKNLAHTQRAAHPILNEDVSKCRQCHPQECDERVAYFDSIAGISKVRVAAPYTPRYPMEGAWVESAGRDAGWLLAVWEIVPLVIVAGLALLAHILLRQRHKSS